MQFSAHFFVTNFIRPASVSLVWKTDTPILSSITLTRTVDSSGTETTSFKNEKDQVIPADNSIIQQLLSSFDTALILSHDMLRHPDFCTNWIVKTFDLESDYQELKEQTKFEEVLQQELAQYKSSLSQLSSTTSRLESKVNAGKRHQELQSELLVTKQELLWASVTEFEKEKEGLVKQVKEEEYKVKEIQTQIKAQADKMNETQILINAKDNEATAKRGLLRQHMMLMREWRQKADVKIRKTANMVNERKQKEAEICNVEKENAKLMQQEIQLANQSRTNQIQIDQQGAVSKRERDQLEPQVFQASKQIKNTEVRRDSLLRLMHEKEDSIASFTQTISKLEPTLDTLKLKLLQEIPLKIKKVFPDIVSQYYKLLILIENNKSKFKHLPIGPVAFLIKPKEEKWKFAVESTSQYMHWFILDSNPNDRSLFIQLAMGAGLFEVEADAAEFIHVQPFAITTIAFERIPGAEYLLNQIVVDPHYRCGRDNYPIMYTETQMEQLQATIWNALISKVSLHKDILVESKEQGVKLFDTVSFEQCRSWYSLDYFRGSRVSTKPFTTNPCKNKLTQNAQQTEAVKEIQSIQQQYQQSLLERAKQQQEVISLRTEIQSVQSSLNKLYLDQLSLIQQLTSKITSVSKSESSLNSALTTSVTSQAAISQQIAKNNQRITIIKQWIQQSNSEDNSLDSEMDAIEKYGALVDQTTKDLVLIDRNTDTLKQSLREYQKQIIELTSKRKSVEELISKMKKQVTEREAEIQTAITLAQQLHKERIHTSKTLREIVHNKNKLQKELKELGDTIQEPDKGIEDDLLSKKQEIEACTQNIQETQIKLQELTQSISVKRQKFGTLWEKTQVSINSAFTAYTAAINLGGSIRLINPSCRPIPTWKIDCTTRYTKTGFTCSTAQKLSSSEDTYVKLSFVLSLSNVQGKFPTLWDRVLDNMEAEHQQCMQKFINACQKQVLLF